MAEHHLGRRRCVSVVVTLLGLLVLLTGGCSPAAGPDARQEQLILWPMVGDGATYRRVAYPAQAGAMRVLADTPVVIEARRTEVYYWPITREYRADLLARNEPVPADVRITDASGVSRVLLARPYVLWYPHGVASGTAQILVDEAALEAHQRYVRDARAYAAARREYDAKLAEHNDAVNEWLRQAADGVDPLPPPPPEFSLSPPEPYHAYATEPAAAPVVSLPAGDFKLELIGQDGQPVAGGTRQLISIGSRRNGIGYAVVPGSRWTQPLTAFDPADTIYVSGDSDLYLEAVSVAEYNAADFVRLLDPQTFEAPDDERYFWTPRSEIAAGRLEASRAGETTTIERAGYRVMQVPGQERGYTIVPLAEHDPAPPDLMAMHLPAALLEGATISVSVDGSPLPGSTREIRRVNNLPEWLIYAPAVLALLLLLLGAQVNRRRRRPSLPVAGRERRAA